MTKEELRIVQKIVEHMQRALMEISKLAEGKTENHEDAYRLTISKKVKPNG